MEGLFVIEINNKQPYRRKEEYLFCDGFLSVFADEKAMSRCFLYDEEEALVFAELSTLHNESAEDKQKYISSFLTTSSQVKKLQWGFVLHYNRKKKIVRLINDIFGLYPLYYHQKDQRIIISNRIKALSQILDVISLNYTGVLDFFLFNYTLLDRTLIKDINQLKGGSKIYIENNCISISQHERLSQIVHKEGNSRVSIDKTSIPFVNCINNGLNKQLQNNVAITGGFDSKIVLASMLRSGNSFNTYTFGTRGSVDHILGEKTSEKFGLNHSFLDLGIDFQNKLNANIECFISKVANPVLMTLLNYELVNNEFSDSNIITGKMGGEMITGPVIISEVVATRTAKTLINGLSIDKLKDSLISDLRYLSFLNMDVISQSIDNYLKSLQPYIANNQEQIKDNYIDFLSNELYAKFFGVVFSVLYPKHNMINPFMDFDFLKSILRTKISIVNNEPFTTNPFAHLASRKLYAQMVKEIFPPVLNTYLDRGYMLKDVISIYRFPSIAFRYIKNHYFRKRSSVSSNQVNDMKLLQKLVIDVLPDSNISKSDLINREELLRHIQSIKRNSFDAYILRKLILLLGLDYFNNGLKETNKYV